MPELMSYGEIRAGLHATFQDLADADRPALLERCCRLLAALALGTEAALISRIPAPQQEDLRTLLRHLAACYPEEIRRLRAVQTRHAAEVRSHDVPEDVVHAAVTQQLYRDFCGILWVPEPPPTLPWGRDMTPDAFLTVFPGAGWLTAPEVVARLDREHYGGEAWAHAPVDTKLAHVAQMVRQLTVTEVHQSPRHVGESAHRRGRYVRRVYKWVQEFTEADWEDVVRYHERMMRYYQEQRLDLLPTLVEYHPEGFRRLHLDI
jgi:hypothetical protein